MKASERRAKGRRYLAWATQLLQRARLASSDGGIWEAADLQWWWRTPRASDALDQTFWFDDHGPVAAVVLTDWGSSWGCDLISVPGQQAVALDRMWERALEATASLQLDVVDVLARQDDTELVRLLRQASFTAHGAPSGLTWMNHCDRPTAPALPVGFALVDRTAADGPHPLHRRSGDQAEARLRECSLYDAALDLAVVTGDGYVATYALFWFDPVTTVGLVEPLRVEDEFQRRGLGRTLLAAGLDRLARRGTRRLKVGHSTAAARALYVSAGFRPVATLTSFRRRSVDPGCDVASG